MLPSHDSGPVGPPDDLDELKRELRMLWRHPAVGPLASAVAGAHPPLAVASQERFLDVANGIAVGSITTPYLYRIMLGDSRASARADSTATAQFLSLVKILGAEVPNYDNIVKPSGSSPYQFEKDPL